MKHLLVAVALLSMMSYTLFCQTIISGRVTGYDDKPLLRADVHLTNPLSQKPVAETTVADDGTFSLTMKESGIFLLKFTGVNHNPYDVAIYIEKPKLIKLDVQMGSYAYVDSFSTIDIVGDFNKFDWRSAQHMTKQQDGTYTSEFETKSDTFQYQLLKVESTGRSINGTQSDGYKYDGGGDYISIIKSNGGKAKIIFDPSKIVRSNAIAQSHFIGDDSLNRKFSSIYDEMTKRGNAYRNATQAFERTGKDRRDFQYDWSADKSTLTSNILQETTPILKQFYILSYLDLNRFRVRDLDSNITNLVFSDILPTSPLWSLSPFSIYATSPSGLSKRTENYIQEMEEKNADINVRAYLVMNRMSFAQRSHKTEEYFKLYDKMVTEFKDTDVGKMAMKQFSRDLKLKVGTFVPDFSFVSMDDPKTVQTNKTLLGRVYMLDFWSTWCGGCVADMENLHKVYEKFKSKGFEILSLSFDGKLEDVVKFRKNRWKMPWFNSLIEKGFDNDIVKQFDIIGVPTPILVDKTGKIIALNEDVRGEKLEKVLEKVLLQ